LLAETEAAPAKVITDRGSRLARPVARLGLAAFFLIALVGVTLGIATDSWRIDTVVQLVGFAAFAVVGTVLLEQSAHRIGWICLAIGLGGAITGFSQGFLLYADAHPGTQGVAAVAALETFVGLPATVLVFTFLPLLFPDGRLPSSRWRVVAWVAVVDIALFIVAFGLTPTGLFSTRPNPIAILPAGAITDLVYSAVGVVTVATGSLCASALFVRYLRAGAEVRQQLKWVAAAGAVFAASLVASIMFPPLDTFAWTLPVLPIAVGVAVLRYRLYDIDVLIGRALVYVPLTAALGGLYAASIALFQRLFVEVTGQTSDAAIVITTLILAGVFTPARRALEGAVERRYRIPAGPPSDRAGLVGDPALDARITAIARAVVREELSTGAALARRAPAGASIPRADKGGTISPGRTGPMQRRLPVDKKAKTPKKPKQNKAKTAK
jgi:hypothetical protein